MDKDKILDYVRKTPANTNPNVLKTMLDDSGSEMNPGYSCTETTTLLTNESVTTITTNTNINSGVLAYSTPIDANTIKVTFNGTEYVCDATRATLGKGYGAPIGEDGPDFSEYPFQIASGLGNMLFTESAGTYQIKIETVEEVVKTTPCFEKAVNSVIGGSGGSGGGTEPLIVNIVDDETTGGARLDHTWQEIYNAPIAYLNLEIYGLSGLPARLSLIEIGQSRSGEAGGEAGDVTYYVLFGKSTEYYYADSEDGYPEAEG